MVGGAGGVLHGADDDQANSPYSATKAAAGHLVGAYQHTYGLPTVTTSCSNNYGPYQFPEKMLPLMILNAMEGRPLPVYGDGMHQRDWLHVADHCSGIRLVLEKGKLGRNVQHRRRRAAAQFGCGAFGVRCRGSVVPAVGDGVAAGAHYLCEGSAGARSAVCDRREQDSDAARWKAAYDFPSGLEQTVRWYLDNKEWLAVTRAKYDRERLGAGK